jgi:glycosyltransferase involved in cell wall biosynthesis
VKSVIIGCFPPGEGSLNEYTYHLACGLAEHGEDVTVLCDKIPKGPIEETLGSNLKLVRCWGMNSIRTPFSILRKVHKVRPDIVYLNIQFGVLFATNVFINAFCLLLVPILLRITRFPTITILHNFPEIVNLEYTPYKAKRRLAPLVHILAQLVMMSSKGVVVLSRRYKELLTRHYNVTKVEYVTHGVFELVNELPKGRNEKRRLLVFGKITPRSKDYNLVLEAYKQLKFIVPNIELVVAGRVHPADPAFYSEVKSISEKAGAQFIGSVPEPELKQLFTKSDLIILPYRAATGVSGVLYQACGYGLPPLLPSIPELTSIVDEMGIKAFFFLPGDVESLAHAIKVALNNQSLCVEVARHNLEVARTLSFAQTVDSLLRLNTKVLGV